MKTKIVTLLFAALALPASATITLDTTFGPLRDSNGVIVPDGTLWALVVDSNSNSTFTGFGLVSSLSNANVTTPGIADTFFTSGQLLSVGGQLNGDTIFAMGGVTGTSDGIPGAVLATLGGLSLGTNGLATGLNFALLWFPGATFTGTTNQSISSQVGGVHGGVDVDAGFNTAMVIPSDGAAVTVGAASPGDLGGTTSVGSFNAVNLVPEPSTALLGALGVLGLLRRRRA